MKRTVSKLVIAGILLVTQFADMKLASGQVVNTESFDGTTFPPTGWTVTGGFGSLWVRRTTGGNPNCATHSGAGMARFTVMMGPPGDQELMTTPVVDYSGASGSIPTVSLWIYRDGGSTAGDSLSIFVNTANTLAGAVHIGAVARSRYFFLPHNETSDGWYQYTFNVPTSFITNTNYILFNGTSRSGENIFVDDISWDEYPVACTSGFTAGYITSTDTLICGGSGDADLTLNGTGLTGGGLVYQWQSGLSGTGPWTNFGANAGTVNTGTISTATYFRCYVTCTNGGSSDTSSVLYIAVSPNPAPVVTINQGTSVDYCTGNTPLLFIASGATYYTWTPNIAINTVGDSALANPMTTTSYTVVGMDTTGCSDNASITVNVTVSPIVVATVSNDTICSGQAVNLHASGPGFGISYQWQPGNLNGQNQTVAPTSTTVYIVGATSFQTGCTGYDSVQVVVNPTPVALFTYTNVNLTYTFMDASTGATSWFWDFGDTNTDNTQNPVHTYTFAGTYTVTLTVSNGLCSNTYTTIITVLSIEHIQLSNGSILEVYPNPASEIATIEFAYNEPSVKLDVIDYLGQSIISNTLYPASGNLYKTDLDISSLSSGIYFLKVTSKSEIVFLQLVKE
ncbi:MAG: PKD domain-containing protein [Bacteroidota bacterium]